MTLIRESPNPGRALRFVRIYREKRHDQAPHAAFKMRMPRRAAAQIARRQSRGV